MRILPAIAYGTFDLERILRTLRVENDQLMIKASGVYAVENYIMARYHMYWQVYYHPTARAYEAILRALFPAAEGQRHAGRRICAAAG